ncbi:MAG TPA: hypothetical protein VNB28_10380 [Methylomirabilota bacterium]|jgi:hypothetical protein|nr:hypothetical protein [Methylomirabilota bacterium]
MPISLRDRGALAPTSQPQQEQNTSFAGQLGSLGGMEYDPLAGGRGLFLGVILSAILLTGIAALAMLIWAP